MAPRVKLTNPDKVLYPVTGTTKSDIFDYYTGIAEVMVPHIAGRAATRKRWPNGVEQSSFFEKQLASSAPDWLPRASVPHRSGTTTYPIIDSSDGLAWIAQQAALEVHVPQWRFVAEWTRKGEELKPGPATRLVFDLDPGEGVTMAQLAKVARAVRDLIADIGLTTFPLTSGSKGLHLYSPLDKPVSSQGAVALAKRVAQQLEMSMPKLVTATMTKSLRAGKVFVDWSQNSGSKTTIAPYSLRGREYPTVAAPRSWEELDDKKLRQLRYDEVLKRVQRDGDLLAPLDADVTTPDRLTKYRGMRDASKTPEPIPSSKPVVGQGNTFVIQEHHARRLHYDFRLEKDGVLVSWAVPKNLPETTSVNHLAVHTEDHPLEYGGFEGNIPKGEYGAGKVVIWDAGTYEAEKFNDDEVIVNLHGSRISGRYALIQTNGDQWLAHRMKDQKIFEFDELAPMLSSEGSVAALKASQWAFEGKWDGYRLLVDADHGAVRLRSRSGRDVTGEYPQLRSIAAELTEHHAVLDGEVVALNASGVPSFNEMQNRSRATRVEYWAFDLLYLDGRSLLRAQLSRSTQAARNISRGWQSRRARTAHRRRRASAGRLRQARLGGCDRQAPRLHLPAGPAVGVVAQGQALEYPGNRDRRLEGRRRRAHQWHRRTAHGHPGRRRPAFRRTGRHRLHRTRPGQPQEDAGAAAHRPQSLRRPAAHPRCQGCDVRRAGSGRGGALQRMDPG